MAQVKRVLIVDDEPNLAIILAHNLRGLGKEYEVEIANTGREALAKLKDEDYALVLTDYMMPDMNGLDLIQEIKHLAPETQVVMMTAYGTSELRSELGRLGVEEYIDKPFNMKRIREVVVRAIERTKAAAAGTPPPQERELDSSVYGHLHNLRVNTGAKCVLLISYDGYTVEQAGNTEDLDVQNMSALIAANFVAATELARMLGTGSVFKSSYHEGPDYNFYAYDVTGDVLLAVIFGQDVKPGVVWFYTKQTAALLKPLLEETGHPIAPEDDFLSAMDDAIGSIFSGNDD